MIFYPEYWMGRDVLYASEFTAEVRANAADLLLRVNGLLYELSLFPVEVSSGWRPAAINSSIPNAAKRSLHLLGKAVDLKDPDMRIGKQILADSWFLDKYGLWMEDLGSTKGWVHLDTAVRSARAIRVFKP